MPKFKIQEIRKGEWIAFVEEEEYIKRKNWLGFEFETTYKKNVWKRLNQAGKICQDFSYAIIYEPYGKWESPKKAIATIKEQLREKKVQIIELK